MARNEKAPPGNTDLKIYLNSLKLPDVEAGKHFVGLIRAALKHDSVSVERIADITHASRKTITERWAKGHLPVPALCASISVSLYRALLDVREGDVIPFRSRQAPPPKDNGDR